MSAIDGHAEAAAGVGDLLLSILTSCLLPRQGQRPLRHTAGADLLCGGSQTAAQSVQAQRSLLLLLLCCASNAAVSSGKGVCAVNDTVTF